MHNNEINPEVIELFEDEAEDVIVLEEGQTVSPPNVGLDVEPPCVVVEGLLLEEELPFLSKFFDQGEDTVDLYVSLSGVAKKIGKFRVSLDNVLILRNLGYSSKMILPDGKELDLLDESLYIKFIRL